MAAVRIHAPVARPRYSPAAVERRWQRAWARARVYEAAARRSTLKVVSFAPAAANGLFERAQETITEWGQPVAEVIACFSRAGFTGIERVWGTAADPEQDDRLAIVGTR